MINGGNVKLNRCLCQENFYRTKSQCLLISVAKFFSRDGKIVAELKDNKFYINPNNYFRQERPSDHILKVFDQQAQEVLNVEFINPQVIKLLGIFYLPNRAPIIIKDSMQILGGIQMSNNCFGENNVGIHLD